MAKKRIPEVIRDGSEADFIPENFMLIDGAEGSAKMRMDLFGKASSIEDLDEAKYEKPEGGIPKDDLSEAVQGSLELADSALQASDIEGKAEKSEMSITNVSGDTTKKNIQLKTGLSQVVVVDHQDISGKAEKSEMSVSAVSGDDTKKTIQLKSGLTQNVVIEHQDITGKADTSAMSITDVSGDATKKTIQLNTGLSQDVVVDHQDISGKAEKSEMSVSAGEDDTKRIIQLKNGTSQSVVVSHQDISGKAEKSEMSVIAVSGDATKKTVTLKSGLSVDVVTDHKAELPTEGKAEGKVLTINDSDEVIWGDVQGGGSDLPPITPSDEGKFLKVDSGSAVWGEGGDDDSGTISIDISEFMSWFIGGASGTAPDVSDIWNTAFDAMCDGKKVEVFGVTEYYGTYRGTCECAIEITSAYGTLKDLIDMLISSGQVSTVEEAKAAIMDAFEAGYIPSSFVLLPETTVEGYYVDIWKFDLIAPFVEDDTQPTHIHPAYEITYMKPFPVIGLRMDTIEGTFDNPLKNIELYSAQITCNHGVITGWKYENPYGEESDYKEYLQEKCTYSDLYDASQRGLRFAITAPLKLEPCTQGTYNYFKSEYIALNVETDLQFGDGTLTLSVPSVAMAYENGFIEKEIISFLFNDLEDYIGAPKPLMYSSTWLLDEGNTNKILLQSESVTSIVVAPEPEPEPAPSYEYIILQNFLTGHTIGTPESGTGYSPFYSTYPSDKASIGWDNKWVDTIGVTGSIVDTTPGAQLVFEDPDSTKRFDFSQYEIALGRLPFGYLDISSNNVKGAAYANVSLPQEFTIEAWYLNTDSYDSYVKFLNLYSATLDKKLEIAANWCNATFAGTEIYSNWDAYTPLRSWNHVAITCDGTNLYIFANGTKVGTVVIANVSGLAEFLASTLELRFNEAYVSGSYTYHNATWYAQIAVCKSCKWTADFKRPYISF